MKLKLLLLASFFYLTSNAQLVLSPNGNGVVTVTYGELGDWTIYDPISDPVYLYLWVESSMNSLGNYYADDWFNSSALVPLTWNGTAHVGTIDFNTHSFNGFVIPTGTTVTNFQLILRTPDGSRQSANLLASNFGYTSQTLSANEYLKTTVSIDIVNSEILINGIENNQKFTLYIFDVSGKQIKKLTEKSKLNIGELSKNIYFLKLITEEGFIITKKIL